MSTCSLLSSLTMTALFRASCTPCRWHVRPGIIALPFQVFSRRPLCFTFLSILFELVQTYRSGLHPNPTHPCSEVSEPWRDSTLLAGGGGGRIWDTQLRAAELKARGSCQWNVTVSPTIEGSPCCLTLRQLSWQLITHRLLFSVLFRPRSAKLKSPLQYAKPGLSSTMEGELLPKQQFPPIKWSSGRAEVQYRKWPNRRPLPNKCLLSNKHPHYAVKIVLDAPL